MFIVGTKKAKRNLRSAKELLKEMKNANKDLFTEIADFIALLEKMGVTSYKLTGSIQEPIITKYSVF